MSQYMYLSGAEEVARAGHDMRSAAEEMSSAASTMMEAVRMQSLLLDRLEQILLQHRGGGDGR